MVEGKKGGNFGYEALNDIYAFLRMFRTFSTKRKKPCLKGSQQNIIYVSHLAHANGIWLLMKKIFNIEPSYYETVKDEYITEAFEGIKKQKSTGPSYNPNYHEPSYPTDPKKQILGKASAPVFFS